ncbi:MAG: sporulation integral membrane protein YtvI [Provencibacterium sp.]|jgi:sporulation integral membrane protein YtvI|nr:sporulation integral membrane protein YtvI [Provencibacterium sp.]
MPEYEDRVRFIINILFVGTIIGLIAVVLRLVVPYTLPFLIGLSIAFILKPVALFITRNTPFRRRSVSIVVISLFYLALTSLFLTILAVVFSQLGRLLQMLPQFYSEGLEPLLGAVNAFLYSVFETLSPEAADSLGQVFDLVLSAIGDMVSDLSAEAVGWAADAFKGLPMFLTTLLFTVISSILISSNYTAVTSFLLRQLPSKYRHMVLDAKDFMVGSLFRMLKAYVMILAITMVELVAGLWLLRVELALVIGVLIAALDILPLIGTGGILIPWALVELAHGRYFLGGGLLVLFAAVTVIRQIIEPKIVGSQIGLHPVVTIAAMYLGLRAFGFWGLILAPLCALLLQYLNDNGKIHLYK